LLRAGHHDFRARLERFGEPAFRKRMFQLELHALELIVTPLHINKRFAFVPYDGLARDDDAFLGFTGQ